MSAEIRVDRITSRSGINTFSFTETGISYGYNVGFGTTSPRANVDVEGNLIVTGGNAGIGTTASTSRLNVIGDVRVSGVVTATSFVGDGTNLTNTGSTLSAASGSQRVVVTSQTSGTMTASATDAALTFTQSTGTLNATNLVVSGNASIGGTAGTVTIGIGTTALLVEGNARVTGILTVGSSSITLNGSTNTINVGTGLTLNSSGLNVTGVITATSFVGSGANLTGIANTANIVSDTITVGVLTATSINVPPVPITFSPAIGATDVNGDSNIIITFNQLITKGTGNITLRSGSAGGTAFSTIGVSSSSVSISGGAVTIDPPSNIGVGVTTFVVVDAGAFSGLTTTSINALINTYSFTTANVILSSINPANGATNVGVDTNITLTFPSAPTRGTGTVELRAGSTSGSLIESFNAASSDRISISGNNYIIDPTSNLGFSTSIHTIIPSTAIVNYVGLNTTGADTHSFTTAELPLGSSYEGGFVICKASPIRWVVSPYSAEVSRNWYNRNDANTRAQQVSGCTGWFVPTSSQLQNPGYCCRSFWGPSPCYSSTFYWSPTEYTANSGFRVNFGNGGATAHYKPTTHCVRSFRCVTY